MSQENVELVRRIFEGWSRGDFSVGKDLLTADFEWRQLARVEVYANEDEALAAAGA